MKTSFFTLLAALSLAAFSQPAQAGPGSLQWRKTTCQLQNIYGEVVLYTDCTAGFAYDTAVRAIKWEKGDFTEYEEVGRPGVQFTNTRECLKVNYDDGEKVVICTVPTPEELGIQGD